MEALGPPPGVISDAVLQADKSLKPVQTENEAVERTSTAPSKMWEQTLKKITPAIVALRCNSTRAFDGENSNSTVATGFVVDKERGYILTNRHVVTLGPIVAEATFINKEEVSIQPVYRDPIHDFGIFKFDPSKLRFLELAEVELAPSEAFVGCEIRVVGNDAGEKLSILQGTLARLDREAPHYSSRGYNDFNTWYYAAASGTPGGSSGSPVINVHGRAVCLNAGGRRRAASSFYLPLDRVVRALTILQREGHTKNITRGTMQTVFRHRGFDEVNRLGLHSTIEKEVRRSFPESTGMLVVDHVLLEGPAAGKLEPGDVLIKVNGEFCCGFFSLEETLDDSVGGEISVEVSRGSALGKEDGEAEKPSNMISISLSVQDLHSITPSKLLEVGGAIVHTLSYHQALNAHLPVRGVYLAQAGYMFDNANVPSHSIIDAVGNMATPNIEAAERAFSLLRDKQRFPLRYRIINDQHVSRVTSVIFDKTWFKLVMRARDDSTGLWPVVTAPQKDEAGSKDNETAIAPMETTFMQGVAGLASVVERSLVTVTFIWYSMKKPDPG